jgi:hypothetical protein
LALGQKKRIAINSWPRKKDHLLFEQILEKTLELKFLILPLGDCLWIMFLKKIKNRDQLLFIKSLKANSKNDS